MFRRTYAIGITIGALFVTSAQRCDASDLRIHPSESNTSKENHEFVSGKWKGELRVTDVKDFLPEAKKLHGSVDKTANGEFVFSVDDQHKPILLRARLQFVESEPFLGIGSNSEAIGIPTYHLWRDPDGTANINIRASQPNARTNLVVGGNMTIGGAASPHGPSSSTTHPSASEDADVTIGGSGFLMGGNMNIGSPASPAEMAAASAGNKGAHLTDNIEFTGSGLMYGQQFFQGPIQISTDYFRVDGPLTRIGDDVTIKAKRIVINGIDLPPNNWRADLKRAVAAGGKTEAQKEAANSILSFYRGAIQQVTPTMWEQSLTGHYTNQPDGNAKALSQETRVKYSPVAGSDMSDHSKANKMMVKMTVQDLNDRKQVVRQTEMSGVIRRD